MSIQKGPRETSNTASDTELSASVSPAATVPTVQRALSGETIAVEWLIDYLSPIVHYRVARVVRRRRPDLSASCLRSCVEDLVQEILMILFSGSSVLKDWEPSRGLTLESFVDMVARRRSLSLLAAKHRYPSEERVGEPEVMGCEETNVGPELRAMSSERLQRLLSHLRAELSTESWKIFELVWLKEIGPKEIAERTGLSRDALYARISRIRKAARRLDSTYWAMG